MAFVDPVKLNKLKDNFDVITEMTKILLDIHERRYNIDKKNLNQFENDLEKYSTENYSPNQNIRDLFFNRIFPLFLKNMNNYVAFKQDLKQDEKKDFISILNIPFLVKLTTKNMILHLIMLTNYKSLLCEATIKLKENYAKELSLLFDNLNFNCLMMEIDKEMASNIMINGAKKNSDLIEFTNLKRVYEDVFKYMNASFENQKFVEIFKTISDLTLDLKNMIKGNNNNFESKDLKECIKLDEQDLDMTNLSCFLNYDDKNDSLLNEDILKMITSQNDMMASGKADESFSSQDSINEKVSDNKSVDDLGNDQDSNMLNSTNDMDSEDMKDFEFENPTSSFASGKKKVNSPIESESEGESEMEQPTSFDFDSKDSDFVNKVDLTNLFETLKSKLLRIQEIYNNHDNSKFSKKNTDEMWKEIVKIYEKFDSILEKLIQDTNKLKTEYFSPQDANAELIESFKEINDDNIYKYLSLDNNLDMAQTAILSALPFQNIINKQINECTIVIQNYLSEYEQIEKKLTSNKILISSLVRHQLHSIKGSNVTFPLINFLPVDLIEPYSNLILNFDMLAMFDFFKKIEQSGYFLSVCGFVCTPIEKLMLVSESKSIKLFDNSGMIQKMENSYIETVKNLFLFIEMFVFQVKKHLKQVDFKSAYYYSVSKNDSKMKKEITNTSQDYIDFPFSFQRCISSTFHSAVSNQPQFKQSLMLVQSFFGMVEPIFIISCLLKKNELHLLEIVEFLANQNSYEYNMNERTIKFEIPLLLEAFFIRFLVFYMFLNTNLKIATIEAESINLECENKDLIKIFTIIKSKIRILEKFKQYGVNINYGDKIVIEFDIKQQVAKNNTSFTIKEEYFTMCNDYDKKLPDILSFIHANNDQVVQENNFNQEKLVKNYKKDEIISNIDCLRILQQLDNSLFGAISIQYLTMVEYNFSLSNIHFSEKKLTISF